MIIDPRKLAAEIGAIVREEFGGSRLAAAKAARIPQPTFHWLAEGSRASIQEKTVNALERLFGPKRLDRLRATLLTPTATYLFEAHRAWIEQQFDQFFEQAAAQHSSSEVLERVLSEAAQFRREEFARLRTHVQRQFRKVCEPFNRKVRSMGHSERRLDLAYVRILGPVLEGARSGLLERYWTELEEEGTLESFVRSGTRRELLLLMRSPDRPRAQDRADRDPQELPQLKQVLEIARRRREAAHFEELLRDMQRSDRPVGVRVRR